MQAGNFLEHATVYGNSYGMLKSELLGKLREGKDVLLNVDVQGAATIREQAESEPELKRALVTVFLTPPSVADSGGAVEEARRGFAGGHPKTAGRGAAGNRAVEEFRLSVDQRHEAGGFAADAGRLEAEKMRVTRASRRKFKARGADSTLYCKYLRA